MCVKLDGKRQVEKKDRKRATDASSFERETFSQHPTSS